MTLPDGRRPAYQALGADRAPRPWCCTVLPGRRGNWPALTGLPAARRVIAATCPAARLHVVEGGGHMLLGQLDQIIEALTPHEG